MIRYILYFPANIIMSAVGLATGWLAALFVDRNGHLPRWLTWYETPDSNCFGIDGDAGFRDRHAHLLGTWAGRWYVCTRWLFRNCMNGFRESVLGVLSDPIPDWAFQWHSQFNWNSRYRFRWNIGWKLNMAKKRPKCMYVFSISPFVKRTDHAK